MPDCAIFADTGAEPQRVYDYLNWLETQLPFPVYRVMWKDGLLDGIMEAGKGDRYVAVPFYTLQSNGKRGIGRRQCTREFKIQPVTQKIRGLIGLSKGERAKKGAVLVESWIGISRDEMTRMKDAREPWLLHRWPLIEKKMTRWHCLDWLQKNDYPLPGKSSCTFCPYHDNEFWLDMKTNDSEGWAQALMVDETIRDGFAKSDDLIGKQYLHRDCVPLKDADLTTARSAGQMSFLDECDGMCGV